jgi:hypothetical protein
MEAAAAVRTRDDFVRLVRQLSLEVESGDPGIYNLETSRYLEALSAWGLFARILSGATVYE